MTETILTDRTARVLTTSPVASLTPTHGPRPPEPDRTI